MQETMAQAAPRHLMSLKRALLPTHSTAKVTAPVASLTASYLLERKIGRDILTLRSLTC